MRIACVWEHNGEDSLLYAENLIGAFTRGESREIALRKMEGEVRSYLRWRGESVQTSCEIVIVQEKSSGLAVCDADSDVLFETEKAPLDAAEYYGLKKLALRSARDFLALYEAIPDKGESCLAERETFHGKRPRTAEEMYAHTKNVNSYYFGEIGVAADCDGTIFASRSRGFESLEQHEDFLANRVYSGSFGEEWTLRKVLRRFLWHDRIHAKAMYRMAIQTFGRESVPNVYQFQE